MALAGSERCARNSCSDERVAALREGRTGTQKRGETVSEETQSLDTPRLLQRFRTRDVQPNQTPLQTPLRSVLGSHVVPTAHTLLRPRASVTFASNRFYLLLTKS